MTGDCDECMADALLQVYAARDRLYYVLWAQTPAVPGIDRAISELFRARRMLLDVGVEP